MNKNSIFKLVLLLSFSILFAKPADSIVNVDVEKDSITKMILRGDVNKIDFYIKHGFDINKKINKENLKPILVAVVSNHIEIVELLLKNGANVNDSHNSGMTTLMYAIKLKNARIVKLLVDNKVNINQVTVKNGVTPLIYAVKLGEEEIIDILLKNKADVYAIDINGYSALHYALHYHGGDVLQMILDARKENSNVK